MPSLWEDTPLDDNRRLSLIVGTFVLSALAALVLTILSLSSQQGVWTDRYHLVAYYENVQGLIPNAPVRLAGTPVGRIESVELGTRDSGIPAVVVRLQVDRAVQDRIRQDSRASIGTIGLLGDRYVEVSLGTPLAPALGEGDEIATANPIDINQVIDKGALALESVAELARNLNEVVEEFDKNSGGRGLAASIDAVADVVEEIQDGEGLLHSLIYDDYEGSGVVSIENSLVTLEGILDEIAHGDGVMHSIIYDTLTEQDIILEVLEAGSRLNSILAKMDRGEGTFGLLLNDPTLYEDIKVLVDGANRSAVVRTLIRMSAEDEEN